MADKYIEETVQLEDSRYLSVENGPCLRTGLALNVDAFIVQLHIAESLYGVLTVTARDDIWSGDRHGQLAPVVDKTAGKLTVFLVHGICFEGRGLFAPFPEDVVALAPCPELS